MSNKYKTVFYIGVTSNLEGRIWEHINHQGSAFVKRYKVLDLVYHEFHNEIAHAIARERQLKSWHRQWKINLINSVNPEMKDLKGDLGIG